MKSTTLFLLTAVVSLSMNAQKKFNVYYTDETKSNNYNFDKFIFVHNFFADAFYRTDLNKQLSSEEMAQVIETVRQRISKDNKIKFVFPQSEKPDAELLFSIVPETKDGPIIVLSTNFDQNSRKFNEEDKNHLVRWYFIRNNLIIYRKNLFSKDDEKKFIKEKEKGELVELYMFDEITENDSKVKPLIDEILSDEKSTDVQKLQAYLYNQEYYFSIGQSDLAQKANTELNDFYDKNQEITIPKNYLLLKKMANSEFEIMTLIK
ncbi:hypothetical protein [Flavobacterium sp. 3HN19-14]|uniref:hypothetical protein n=1 Tax=Flavobacterium sp. 3HN19-14 TaxID=3448133 RepID=UPI003EDFFE8C